MSYRRRENRRDEWVRLREGHADVVAAAGLPETVVRTEDAFAAFLLSGETADGAVSLRAMSDGRFLRPEAAVRAFFPDLGVHDGSTAAFAAERLRRFGRYG